MARTYYVYILASESRELYVGVTNDVYRRVLQHRTGLDPNSYTAWIGRSGWSIVSPHRIRSLRSVERSRSRAGLVESGWS
jgi:predicted GIY-YIG superfamily endonuclease